MPNKSLIGFLAIVPIINSYIYSYYMYNNKNFKEFTKTIINIPYYIICAIIFYGIIHSLYAPDKLEILYIYGAVATASILYTVLSVYDPTFTDTLNKYVPTLEKQK